MRSIRTCGVCLIVVHGRVEALDLENTGVFNEGSLSGQSLALDSWAASSAPDDVVAFWTASTRSSSISAVPTCEFVSVTAFGVRVSGSSSVCFSATSNCRKPNASLRYLASSAARLGPETCTKISIGGVIMALHFEKAL